MAGSSGRRCRVSCLFVDSHRVANGREPRLPAGPPRRAERREQRRLWRPLEAYPLSILASFFPPVADSSFHELPLGLGALHRVELSGLLISALAEFELRVLHMLLLCVRGQVLRHRVGAVVGDVGLNQRHELLRHLLMQPKHSNVDVPNLGDPLSLKDAFSGCGIKVQPHALDLPEVLVEGEGRGPRMHH